MDTYTLEFLRHRGEELDRRVYELESKAVEMRSMQHRVLVAEAIMTRTDELPEGSTITLAYWDALTNDDGSYDMGLSWVYDEHGDALFDFMSESWPMGWADGDHTDIDEFLTQDEEPRIDVDKVRAWVKSIAPTTITRL